MDEILKIPVIVHRCESDLAKERGGHTCLAFRAASLARLLLKLTLAHTGTQLGQIAKTRQK